MIALLAWALVTQVFANDGEEVAPPKPTTASETTTAPTTEPEKPAAPIVLPSCESLYPEGWTRTLDFVARHPDIGIEYGETGMGKFAHSFGPAAQEALTQVTQQRPCNYPYQLESGFFTSSAELTDPGRARLIAALRADGDFIESTVDGATVFIWTDPEHGGHWGISHTVHAFVGDVWFFTFGPEQTEESTKSIITSIRAANPALP